MWPNRDQTPLWDPTSSHEQRRIPTKLNISRRARYLNISRRARRRFLQTVHIPQPLFSSLLQDPRLKQVRRLELILRGTKHQAEKKRRSIFFQFWSKERFFFWVWQSHFLKELSSNNHGVNEQRYRCIQSAPTLIWFIIIIFNNISKIRLHVEFYITKLKLSTETK